HHSVDEARDVALAPAHQGWRVLAVGWLWHDPGDRRQPPGLGRRVEVGEMLDVGVLMILMHVDEARQHYPDVGHAGPATAPGHATATGRLSPLRATVEVVGPTHLVLVQQVRDV